MKLSLLALPLAVVAFATTTWSTSAANPAPADTVDYKFRDLPLNSMGVKSLAELRGKPVVIDFWGKNCGPCVGGAVPAAVKLQEEYGDDVQVIFVESQNTPKDVWEALAWNKKWMANNAWWTVERPVTMAGDGLPYSVLVGIDGAVIMQGHPGDLGNKFDETLAAEVKKAKSAPAGTPEAVKAAWKSFAKGEAAAAIAECEKLDTDDSNKAKDEFIARLTARIGRTGWMIQNGFLAAAEKTLGDLEKSVKGNAELSEKVAAKKAQLASKELDLEREADKAFQSFVADVAKKKPFEAANVKKAQGLAEKFKGTKTATRFERFVALSKVELNK